ncbi:hypothetical protein BDB01DRAFT_833516 [Pilobolus umbonatus]|nr:hypothetical protein BDB01DRAFT_833516 [Pilobolus umbonatus]
MIKIADTGYEVKHLADFTTLDKSRAELYGYVLGYFERIGLCETIGVTPSELLDFIVDVDHGYLPNAYHSFYHAIDVVIVLYQMLTQYDVASYLSRVDMAALLIAGLCHDIGHPGKNNNYQVNMKTDLAIRYSNKSVLESYSCTITMDLLTKHKLFRNITRTSRSVGLPTTESEMRTAIIKMILATDMIFHYELQENFANLLEIISEANVSEDDFNHMRLSNHKPMLPSTTEEDEGEEEVVKTRSTCCTHYRSTRSSVSSAASLSPTSPSNSQLSESITHPTEPTSHSPSQEINNEESNSHTNDSSENEDIQVRDIFSSQGAKSAISYFRRKSYFEEDIIPANLKNTSMAPLSSVGQKELVKDEEDVGYNTSQYVSGADLIVTKLKVNGVEKIIHTPPNYIMEPQQRIILCQIILHGADISNALRPWPICKSWSNLVCEEFFRQGEAERSHNLPVSPNMDPNQTSQTAISLQFGDFVVSPYFEIFAALFPKGDAMLKTLADNRTQWLLIEEQEEEAKHKGAKDDEENQGLPPIMLPNRPIINPSGRRVSVAAGMVVIPDELEERTVGTGKYKRKYWGIRSVSHSDISQLDKVQRKRSDVIRRRKSEEPSHLRLSKIKTSPLPAKEQSQDKCAHK